MKLRVLALAVSLVPTLTFAASELDPVREDITVSRPYESPLRFGLDLKYVPLRYSNFTSASGHGGQIAFEWIPLGKRVFGKPVIGVSAGGGHIKDMGDPAKTRLTTIPLTAYLGYRFDFLDEQLVVPFAKFGRNVTWIKRRPGTDTRYDAWEYSLGVEICLNGIDSRSAHRLDASTGINGTYLIAEWVKSSPQRANQPDLRHEEWQLGLRFEM